MNNNGFWGSIGLLGLLWVIVADNNKGGGSVIDKTGSGPVVERLTPRTLPKYIVTQLVISKLAESITPSHSQAVTVIAPPDSSTGEVVMPPPITDPVTDADITVNCKDGETDKECAKRILRDDSSSTFQNSINQIVELNKKRQDQFMLDYTSCEEEVLSKAPDDYLLIYDLKVHCMINKGHNDTISELAKNSSLLRDRLEVLDSNKETLNSYIDN